MRRYLAFECIFYRIPSLVSIAGRWVFFRPRTLGAVSRNARRRVRRVDFGPEGVRPREFYGYLRAVHLWTVHARQPPRPPWWPSIYNHR